MKACVMMWACMGFSCAALAAEITMTGSDAFGTSSFNTGVNWLGGVAPVSGNTYKTGNNTMRSPADSTTATNHLFAGDRLTLSGGGSLSWKSQGSLTITDLVMDGGSIGHALDNYTGRLFGNLTVSSASSITANEPNPRIFMIFSPVSGVGNLTIAMNQTNWLKQTSFLADNSGYTGKLTLRGRGKFGVCAEEGLGGNPTAFAANQVTFEGSTFIATNSFTLDDPNRGITLNNTLNAGSYIYPGGVFEVNNAATVTAACVISGAGPLTKRGNGTLVLAANNTNTGLTTVEAGRLRLLAGATGGTPSLVVTGSTSAVMGEGTLSNVTLVAGGRLGAEKGGWAMRSLSVLNTTNVTFDIDLSEADPAVTLIRVGGPLTKLPMQVFQFVVTTNNVTETPYQILSASNLTDFASHDFCVTPPWLGELSVTNDAGGGQVLLFTPAPPEKIVFQVASDPINTTAFLRGERWSDGLSPTNAPTGVKTYVNRGYEMRTPHDRTMTFGGKRLIMDGKNLALKGAAYMPTITDLTMMNDASFSLAEPIRDNMAGSILLRPVFDAGKTYAMRVGGSGAGRYLYLYSALSGYGDLFLQNVGNPAYSNNLFTFFQPNTNFFGKVHVDGHTNLWLRIADEERLGGNPPLFRADQLRFNGGGISVTNRVTLDDSNRGITLLATGGLSPIDDNPGGYPTGSTTEELTYAGGCTLRPEGTNTLTVTCPITGPGRLVKNGTGTLVLGGANTYTGQTEVVAGTLDPLTSSALGTGPLLVKPAGRLLRRHPDASLPAGVALGSDVTFEPGSAVSIEFAEGFSVTGGVTVPLFTMPTELAIDPANVPVEHGLSNYTATVITSDAGGSRTLFSARLVFQGSIIMLK